MRFVLFIVWAFAGYLLGVLINVGLEVVTQLVTGQLLADPYPFPFWVRALVPWILAASAGFSYLGRSQEKRLAIPKQVLNATTPTELAQRTTNTKYLSVLAQYDSHSVRRIVASNRLTPVEVLETMTRDQDASVRSAASETLALVTSRPRTSDPKPSSTPSQATAAERRVPEDRIQRVERLAVLKESGHLTQEEFERLKRDVLTDN